MSDERMLAVIPRDELVRARDLATQHVHAGYVITAFSALMLVAPWLVTPLVMTVVVAFSVTGAIAVGYGLSQLVPSLRARRTIDAKLHAQEIPSARLLR